MGKTIVVKDPTIRDQVGEAGQKGILSYISLTYQIRNVHQVKFQESKVASADIGPMTPIFLSHSYKNTFNPITENIMPQTFPTTKHQWSNFFMKVHMLLL